MNSRWPSFSVVWGGWSVAKITAPYCYPDQPALANYVGRAKPGGFWAFMRPANRWNSVCVFSASGDRDVFSSIFHWYAATAAGMSVGLFWWFVRAAVALEFQTIVCAWVFKSHRSNLSAGALMAINWSIFLLGWLLVAALPLESLHVSPVQKGWILALAALAVVILPIRIAGLLVPTEGWRRIVAAVMYALLAILLVIQLLFA